MKIFNDRIPLLGAVILASTLLSGCPSPSPETTNNQSTPSAIKITASLGRFSVNTVVNLKKLDGTLLGTGSVLGDGTATVNIDAAYTGPVVVEVVGGSNVFYFDEKTGAISTTPYTGTLRSAMPAVQANVGVTSLTNAAVAKLEAAGTLATSTASSIQTANLKVAQVFGLTDILTPPNPVNAKVATLDLAKEADKYALVLAALANTATSGSNAAAVSAALALDLKDDKLDGLDATSATPAVAIEGYVPANIATQYQVAAGDYATAASVIIATATPIVIDTDVSNVAVLTNQSDVTLAKAMFTDLRSTAFSLSNAGKTGFLDIQSAAIAADTLANVGPDMSFVTGRAGALDFAVQTLKDRNAYDAVTNTLGFITVAGNPIDNTTALTKVYGDFNSVMSGWGGIRYCWSSPTATLPLLTMSCTSANSTSGVITGPGVGYLKMIQWVLTETSTGNYTYTATRKNVDMAGVWNGFYYQWAPSGYLNTTGIAAPAGNGSYVLNLDVTGKLVSATLNGTFPPSTATTGVDTVNATIARTLLAGNNYRFAFNGTASAASSADATKTRTNSFNVGSYVDMDETNVSTTGSLPIGGKLIGTTATAAVTLSGTFDVSAFTSSKDLYERIPTSVSFNGSISNATGAILTGTLNATIPVADQLAFNANPLLTPESATNYRRPTMSFTGTIQQPNLPVLSLTLANTRDSYYQNTTAITYAFGTKTITGSTVSLDSATTHTNTMSVTNQDGIQFGSVETINWSTFPSTKSTTATLTRSGTPMANSINMTTGIVNYIDGTSATIY